MSKSTAIALAVSTATYALVGTVVTRLVVGECSIETFVFGLIFGAVISLPALLITRLLGKRATDTTYFTAAAACTSSLLFLTILAIWPHVPAASALIGLAVCALYGLASGLAGSLSGRAFASKSA